MQWVQTALHQHAEQEALSGFEFQAGVAGVSSEYQKAKGSKTQALSERSLHGERQNSTCKGEGQHVLISNVHCHLPRIRKSDSRKGVFSSF